MPVVYSTCSSDVTFPLWNAHSRVGSYDKSVTVKGGANVQHKRTLITPKGAATVITDDELAILQGNDTFKHMVEEGFLTVDEKANNTPSDQKLEKVIKEELTETDKGSQDNKKTYEKMNKKAPKEETE